MRKILFFILPETGTMNATLKLAMDLRQNGHEVKYIGLPDCQTFARTNGFEFIPVFKEYFPEGSSIEQQRYAALSLRKYLLILPTRLKLFRAFIDYLLAGGDEEFLSILTDINPDLVIYSGAPYVEWPAVMACSLGIKGAYFDSTISPCVGSGHPPVSSNMIPVHLMPLRQRLRLNMEWAKYKMTSSVRFSPFRRYTRELARKYGNTWYGLSTVYKKATVIALPELMAMHPAFDFPSVEIPGRYYIGASIHLDRKEPPFPLEKLENNRPLIFSALGTYVWFDKESYRNFFRTVLEVSKARPEWQWVLVLGDVLNVDELGTVPDNVIVVKSAPQIQLLKRASLMISHGGANTVKDCILMGVPMVVLPLGGDHHGFAARVVYHGLGVRGDIKRLTVRRLQDLIDTVWKSPYIKSQIKLMQQKFVDMDNAKIGLKLVESWLL